MPSKSKPQAKLMAAYLAGFVDGEGTLTVTRHMRKDRPGYRRFNLRLAVYNTNIDGLRVIQSFFGGTLMIAKRKEVKFKDQGQLAWSESQLVPVLEAILPFLIIKKPQAELMLALQADKMPASMGRRNGISQESQVLRAKAYEDFKRMNRRGRDAEQVN